MNWIDDGLCEQVEKWAAAPLAQRLEHFHKLSKAQVSNMGEVFRRYDIQTHTKLWPAFVSMLLVEDWLLLDQDERLAMYDLTDPAARTQLRKDVRAYDAGMGTKHWLAFDAVLTARVQQIPAQMQALKQALIKQTAIESTWPGRDEATLVAAAKKHLASYQRANLAMVTRMKAEDPKDQLFSWFDELTMEAFRALQAESEPLRLSAAVIVGEMRYPGRAKTRGIISSTINGSFRVNNNGIPLWTLRALAGHPELLGCARRKDGTLIDFYETRGRAAPARKRK